MFYYITKKSLFILTVAIVSLLTSCAPQSEVDQLRYELEEFKNPEPPIIQPAQPSYPIVPQNPVVPVQPPAPITPVYGTGNGNNVLTPANGYLTIQTKSANGKLCLRANASKSSACLIEIPNGTSGIYYSNRFQSGDFVWYEVSYNGFFGYLRGDYIFI